MMALQAVSQVQPQWIQEVLNSYATNVQDQKLMSQLAVSGFSLDKALIRKGTIIWIGNNSALQTKRIAVFSCICYWRAFWS